jgi:16S rRNA processing protein RimM
LKSNSGELIQVAAIIAPHGIRGAVSAECLSDNPRRFHAGAELFTPDGRGLKLEAASRHKGRLLLKFSGVDDREQAEKLRRQALFVPQEQAPALPEGEYYHFQLLGLEVREGGQRLGEISDILSYSANDVYVLLRDDGSQTLIPALKSVILRVDVAAGYLDVALPEGL